MTAVTEYRDRMAQYAQCGALELWYDRITFDLMAETALTPERRRIVRRGMEKAANRTQESLLEKMAEFDGGHWIDPDDIERAQPWLAATLPQGHAASS